MNVSPAIYFFMHHGRQLAKLVGSGSKEGVRKWLSLAYAVTPWLKNNYPKINDERLWEDALDTVENMISEQQTITHWPGYPDPNQR